MNVFWKPVIASDEEVLSRRKCNYLFWKCKKTFIKEYEQRKHSLQTGTLYERFMQLLQRYSMQHLEVQFYSNELNINGKSI